MRSFIAVAVLFLLGVTRVYAQTPSTVPRETLILMVEKTKPPDILPDFARVEATQVVQWVSVSTNHLNACLMVYRVVESVPVDETSSEEQIVARDQDLARVRVVCEDWAGYAEASRRAYNQMHQPKKSGGRKDSKAPPTSDPQWADKLAGPVLAAWNQAMHK